MVWGISDFVGMRAGGGERSKGNPPSKPTCVVIGHDFRVLGSALIFGLWTYLASCFIRVVPYYCILLLALA